MTYTPSYPTPFYEGWSEEKEDWLPVKSIKWDWEKIYTLDPKTKKRLFRGWVCKAASVRLTNDEYVKYDRTRDFIKPLDRAEKLW